MPPTGCSPARRDLPECLLGDIIICAEKVLENASEADILPSANSSLVLVHGLLHLLVGTYTKPRKKGSRCGRSRSVIGDRVENYLASGGEAGTKAQQERMDQ
jgi:hypothetical protein